MGSSFNSSKGRYGGNVRLLLILLLVAAVTVTAAGAAVGAGADCAAVCGRSAYPDQCMDHCAVWDLRQPADGGSAEEEAGLLPTAAAEATGTTVEAAVRGYQECDTRCCHVGDQFSQEYRVCMDKCLSGPLGA